MTAITRNDNIHGMTNTSVNNSYSCHVRGIRDSSV